jgi:thiamine pyrophosphate-dependent acetolactate synthase large subunit-like protein
VGARMIQVDIDPNELGRTRDVEVAIAGDAGAVLGQMLAAEEGRPESRYARWVSFLRDLNEEKRLDAERAMSTDQVPIHPFRLCREVRNFLDRRAVLCVDGQEILNFGRQSIPTHVPGHRLNSGPLGTMDVGLPFGLGAKVACPDEQVVVLHGDGSMGLNAMELDTAARHGIQVLTVVSNNGGWTASDRPKAGRDLGYTRFDLVAQALGCHGEHVTDPGQIRPALERAAASGRPAVVNVITDPAARARTAPFATYST